MAVVLGGEKAKWQKSASGSGNYRRMSKVNCDDGLKSYVSLHFQTTIDPLQEGGWVWPPPQPPPPIPLAQIFGSLQLPSLVSLPQFISTHCMKARPFPFQRLVPQLCPRPRPPLSVCMFVCVRDSKVILLRIGWRCLIQAKGGSAQVGERGRGGGAVGVKPKGGGVTMREEKAESLRN